MRKTTMTAAPKTGAAVLTAALLLGGAGAATVGSPAVAAQAKTAAHTSSGSVSRARSAVHFRSYDRGLLKHTNRTRKRHHRRHYNENTKLWRIAHAWAEHLAHAG